MIASINSWHMSQNIPDAQLIIYPDAGHDAWSATYANQALYDWFLQHRRP